MSEKYETNIDKHQIENWMNQLVEEWPRVIDSKNNEPSSTQRATLFLLSAILSGLAGGELAENIVGEQGFVDELVSLLFAFSGGQFTWGFTQRFCSNKPKLTQGLWPYVEGGLALGFGLAALTAVPLVSVLDGGIIASSILIPTGIKLISNSRGGNKVCSNPRCKSKQSCNFAVCRECLNIFSPADPPDCYMDYYINWYGVSSFLQRQGLNYFEAKKFIFDNWELPITKNGQVDCKKFLKWLNKNRSKLRKYQKTILSSEETSKLLDLDGL